MLNWLRDRRKRKLNNSGGLVEKKAALEKTNAVADAVIAKMEELKNNRRWHNVPIEMDRRGVVQS